jgi:hypothetical protein
MRGSVVLAGAILGAVSLVGVPAQAGAAVDPYSPSVDTQCTIDVPAVVEPGDRVVIRVSVDANSPTPPKGKVTVTITERPSGDFVWDKTVSYNGGTKRIVGPVLAKDRQYTATARFVPSDDSFERCRASEAFAVDAVDDGGPDDNDDDGPGGLLPDTGGPALLWLLLGLGLVGGGSATVVYARRRTSPAAA